MIMKVHLGSDFPRAVHLLLLGESGDGGPAQGGQLGEQLQDKKKSLTKRRPRELKHQYKSPKQLKVKYTEVQHVKANPEDDRKLLNVDHKITTPSHKIMEFLSP